MGRRTEKLSCMQVQHSIKEYLLDQMTIEQAEAFVKHVRGCKACRDEVEEYYAFSSALMQLDTMENTDKGDFFMNIEKRLERTENQAMKNKRDHRKRRVTYCVVVLLVAAAMGISFGI